MGFSIIDNNLDKVITNTKTNSLKKLNLRNRPLTASEILLAQSIYKNTIDYSKVKIFEGSYFPLDAQNEDTFVTPNGNIYIPTKHYRLDYSLESNSYKKIFIHELGHVWQHQRKINVLLNAGALQACNLITATFYDPYTYNIWEGSTVYQYIQTKSTKRMFLNSNLEAQAEIFADFWVVKNKLSDKLLNEDNRENWKNKQYQDILKAYSDNVSEVIK